MGERERIIRNIERLQLTPTEISDAQLDSFVGAIGSHEARALTFLALDDIEGQSGEQLYQGVSVLQGTYSGWLQEQAPEGYCKSMLISRGLVVEISPPNQDSDLEPVSYIRTQHGNQAIPLAGLLLDFSRRHPEVTLYDIFSGGHSSIETGETVIVDGREIQLKRGPASARIAIFRELLQLQPGQLITESELAMKLNLQQTTVNRHLHNLGITGIIQHSSMGPDQQTKFESIPGASPVIIREPSISQIIYKFAQSTVKPFTIADVKRHLVDEHGIDPEVVGPQTIRDALGTQIRSESLRPVNFTANIKSHVSLTPEQRILLADLITLVDGYAAGNPEIWAMGQRAAREIISDPDSVSALIEKIGERTPYRSENRIPPEKRDALIVSIVGTYPGVSSANFHRMYQQYSPVPTSLNHTRRFLLEARDAGLIQSDEVKPIHGWVLTKAAERLQRLIPDVLL